MKSVPSLISVGASALCLALGIWLYVLSGSNQSLQREAQKQQQELQNQQQAFQLKQQQFQIQQEQINAAVNINQNQYPQVLQAIANASVKSDKLKTLLTKRGFTVKDDSKNASTPAPGQ